jgi:BolA family transcriptional regulator, general stress-responsive regulator
MMNSDERMVVMRERLENAFQPQRLQIVDDSDKHKGHAGNDGYAGHYTVIISSQAFKDKSLVNAHRDVYSVLNDMIPAEIHALIIKIL